MQINLRIAAAGLLIGLVMLSTTAVLLQPVQRTVLRVSSRSASDFSQLEEIIQNLDHALGLEADCRTGLVRVDHRADLSRQELLSALTSQGIEVRVVAAERILPFNTLSFSSSPGGVGCQTGRCGARAGLQEIWSRWFGGKTEPETGR